MATQGSTGHISEQLLTFQGGINAALGDSNSCPGIQPFLFFFLPL